MMKNNFSKNLKNLRIDNDIKQSALAKILNISQGAYAKYESGQREPSFDTLVKISNLFKVSIDDLLNNSLTTKIDNTLKLSIDYEEPSDISTSINLIEKLNKKKEYYLKEKKRLEILLNKHIPNRISEIDELLDILNKNPPKFIYNNNSKEEFFEEYSNEISANIIEFNTKETNNKYRSIDLIGKVSAGNPCYAFEEIINSFNIPSKLLCPSKDYFILEVKGDSMDMLYSPGDLILIESTSFVNNDDIIIAIIDEEATCKKVHFSPNEIVLIPQSNNPIHKIQTYNPINVHISGKVLGKLSDYIKKDE